MLQQHVAQIAGLEKERDFYYQKLRDVEMICQEPECESMSHIQKILEILYATEVKRKLIESLTMKRKTFFCCFFFQDGFAQPEGENGNGEVEDHHGSIVGSNGNGSALIGTEEETY